MFNAKAIYTEIKLKRCEKQLRTFANFFFQLIKPQKEISLKEFHDEFVCRKKTLGKSLEIKKTNSSNDIILSQIMCLHENDWVFDSAIQTF